MTSVSGLRRSAARTPPPAAPPQGLESLWFRRRSCAWPRRSHPQSNLRARPRLRPSHAFDRARPLLPNRLTRAGRNRNGPNSNTSGRCSSAVITHEGCQRDDRRHPKHRDQARPLCAHVRAGVGQRRSAASGVAGAGIEGHPTRAPGVRSGRAGSARSGRTRSGDPDDGRRGVRARVGAVAACRGGLAGLAAGVGVRPRSRRSCGLRRRDTQMRVARRPADRDTPSRSRRRRAARPRRRDPLDDRSALVHGHVREAPAVRRRRPGRWRTRGRCRGTRPRSQRRMRRGRLVRPVEPDFPVGRAGRRPVARALRELFEALAREVDALDHGLFGFQLLADDRDRGRIGCLPRRVRSWSG